MEVATSWSISAPWPSVCSVLYTAFTWEAPWCCAPPTHSGSSDCIESKRRTEVAIVSPALRVLWNKHEGHCSSVVNEPMTKDRILYLSADPRYPIKEDPLLHRPTLRFLGNLESLECRDATSTKWKKLGIAWEEGSATWGTQGCERN